MDKLLKGWNFFRAFRLVMGLAILGYGYTQMDWLLMMIGATFSLMAVANTACGPFSSSCEVDYKEEKKDGSD